MTFNQKFNKNDFIKKGKKVHNNKYDYSLVEYINRRTKVKIICSKHGVFEQTPYNHLKGHECRKCYLDSVLLTKADFIKKANEVHNNKYDYSLVDFINNKSFIKIICPNHGEYEIRLDMHLQGKGCKYCHGRTIWNKADFIKKANEVHNNKYDYSKLEYIGTLHKSIIICPDHGEYEQILSIHLQGHGCKECYNDTRPSLDCSKNGILNINTTVYNNQYEYLDLIDKVYNKDEKIKIKCPIHGIFYMSVLRHIHGKGCPHCHALVSGSNRTVFCQEDFIKKSKELHDNKYDYSLVEYKGINKKVKILCYKHGEFEQTPNKHINGGICPKCKPISKYKGEKIIGHYLIKNDIKYTQDKTYADCKGDENCLRFDFHLTDLNVLIEYNGIQHYEMVNFKTNISDFDRQQRYDSIKKEYCFKTNIRLIIIKYDENILNRLREEKIIP